MHGLGRGEGSSESLSQCDLSELLWVVLNPNSWFWAHGRRPCRSSWSPRGFRGTWHGSGGTKLYNLRSCAMVSVLTGAKHGSKKPKNRASGYQTKNIRANRCKARILIWKPIPLWCVHLIIVQSSILTRVFGPVSEHLTEDLRREHIMDVGMYKDARQLCFKQQLALVTL